MFNSVITHHKKQPETSFPLPQISRKIRQIFEHTYAANWMVSIFKARVDAKLTQVIFA